MATEEIFNSGEDCKPEWKEANAVFNDEGQLNNHD